MLLCQLQVLDEEFRILYKNTVPNDCAYRIMVLPQPSKLKKRVRLPLGAQAKPTQMRVGFSLSDLYIGCIPSDKFAIVLIGIGGFMELLLKRYAQLIIKVQLKLTEGDSLSINTEANTMQFARLLAREACLSTRQSVTIVETNHGKVVQAYPIDPVEKEIFRPAVHTVVMCHLFDLDANPYLVDSNLLEATSEVGAISKFGHLSDPVFLDRRIAVPWANIPYPGLRWAMELLGKAASEEEMWKLFSSLYRLDSEWASSFWEEQGNLLEYRKLALNKLGHAHVNFVSDGWQLEAEIARDTVWAGGRTVLASKRYFLPQLPIQSLHASLDSFTAQGSFAASRPFYVLGTEVTGARFTVQDGKVTDWQADTGKPALDAFFNIDEGARHVSELSLADNDTIESRYLQKSIHPHFGKEITTTVILGGFSLDTLTGQSDDEDIKKSKLCESLVRLEIPVGDSQLAINLTTDDGQTHQVMIDGVYNL